jgi:hypothetical protein
MSVTTRLPLERSRLETRFTIVCVATPGRVPLPGVRAGFASAPAVAWSVHTRGHLIHLTEWRHGLIPPASTPAPDVEVRLPDAPWTHRLVETPADVVTVPVGPGTRIERAYASRPAVVEVKLFDAETLEPVAGATLVLRSAAGAEVAFVETTPATYATAATTFTDDFATAEVVQAQPAALPLGTVLIDPFVTTTRARLVVA